MNDWLEMWFVFGLTFLGLFFVLYTGQSTIGGKTLKEWIHGSTPTANKVNEE